MDFLSQHPSFKILLPMIVGIVGGNYMYDIEWASYCLPIFIVVLAVCWIAYRKYWMRVFGISICIFFLLLGYARTIHELQPSEICLPKGYVVCRLSIADIPKEKEKSIQCLTQIEAIWKDSIPIDFSSESKLLLYVAKDSVARKLERGDELWVYTKLKAPVKSHLPDTFDYAQYLRQRSICATAYVASGNWQIRGHQEIHSLAAWAQDCRDEVKELYRILGFQGDELAVLSALTIGEKDELDEDIKETYSVAGASHVLAISGLHVGLLYSLLWLLLERCWKRCRYLKLPLYALILLLLWAFALFTGLSTSVVRAVWMCSFFLLFSLRLEPVLSMDTLLAAAFFMLLCKPLWLFDVGCQLSFAAVVSILVFYPLIYGMLEIRNKIFQKVWGIAAVSIAAQIGTAPLVMFYFSRFSTHFLITNIWVIPLVTLVMYISVMMWLAYPLPWLQEKLASLLNKLLSLQNEGLRWIEQLPWASVDGISWELWEVVFAYICVGLIWLLVHKKTFANMQLFLGMCLLWGVAHGVQVCVNRPHTSMVFYSANGCTAVHCLSNHSYSWLVSADSLPRVSALQHLLTPHWNRLSLDTPYSIYSDYESEDIWVKQQILCYKGKTVCILSDERWKNKTSSQPLQVDYLLVSHGYRGGIKELQSLFKLHTVVVDDTLPDYFKNLIQEDCVSMGLSCVWLREQSRVIYDL